MARESCYIIPTEVPAGTFEVHLRGEIDLARKTELHQILSAYARSLGGRVVVDLAQVTFFDVTGLGLLVDLSREAGIRGCAFSIRNVPLMTRRILQIAGLERLLGEDEAVARPGGQVQPNGHVQPGAQVQTGAPVQPRGEVRPMDRGTGVAARE